MRMMTSLSSAQRDTPAGTRVDPDAFREVVKAEAM
jgi:hypothetical protein